MRIKPVQAIDKLRSNQNDLYNRTGGDVRCTILNDASPKQDGSPMTIDRALDYIKEFDSSVVVDLSTKDIPSFLYNKNGKLY